MENLSTHFAQARGSVADTLSQLYARFEHHVPENIEHSVRQYIANISGTTREELFSDIRSLQFTPATVTLALVMMPTIFLAQRLVSSGSSNQAAGKRSKTKKKKPSKAKVANKEIQRILDHVEETYVPQIDSYIEHYAEMSEDDKQYKFKYFEEMLLKELMNLDNVDVVGNDVLRDNRKKVIRFIQDHQRRLDNFKKEAPDSR
ncbi:BAG domain-containing protein [Metschnikowia bicuspidata var. bicuspidata NRRL YB-4993]|uniref:BAG domain-containing protein n=1 Tax=Metschnikowia bicuspidata var. bicuspidata NRRL YB-4993 TaxID=869754 RepID=A0A1A0HER3_9ASCO|nr:BAG domain-containing protein [Metschnikowia bicuspidata var. bicuspidata NRRL YB-4993]OBA22614.1 BAG domain-containing protein [Metschnikowia bicuspidata var. bicuspidata NRRL YB-4993]